MPPDPPESDRAGAFRMGGQDNDDENTIPSEEVRSHGVTMDASQVSARLVEEDSEVDTVVAVLAKDKRGIKKRLISISIGVSSPVTRCMSRGRVVRPVVFVIILSSISSAVARKEV